MQPAPVRISRPVKRILIVTVAIAVVLSAALYIGLRQSAESDIQTYVLTIRIEPSSPGAFTVRFPLVETSNETPSPVAENSLVLSQLANASGRIVETPYGAAFELDASDNVTVQVRFEKRLQADWPYGYIRLSMCVPDCTAPGETYAYAGYLGSGEVDQVSIHANLTFEKRTSRVYLKGFYLCEGTLSAGWGTLRGLYRLMIS